jgi:hypothetical protein
VRVYLGKIFLILQMKHPFWSNFDKICWATFWANFPQTHLVTLLPTSNELSASFVIIFISGFASKTCTFFLILFAEIRISKYVHFMRLGPTIIRLHFWAHGKRWNCNNGKQGCQIFLDTVYQNGGKYTKLPQHYQMAIKNTKWPLNIPNGPIKYQHFPF